MMMNEKEQRFAKLIKEHGQTIYAACYMFSRDADNLDDLHQLQRQVQAQTDKAYDGQDTDTGRNSESDKLCKFFPERVQFTGCRETFGLQKGAPR